MTSEWYVICTKGFYAGQGIDFEPGYIKATTITRAEADAVCLSMIALAYGDVECWRVVSFEEYMEKYHDADFAKKRVALMKQNFALRDSCPLPHKFVQNPDGFGKSTCSVCKTELDRNCANWYMAGRRDEKEMIQNYIDENDLELC